MTQRKIHDVTLPFSEDLPVWPGDGPISLTGELRVANGDSCNATRINCPAHCGTHVDAPWHFADKGAKLDQLPIERWVGDCQVVRIPDSVTRIDAADLDSAGVSAGTTRLLLKTSNSARWKPGKFEFEKDYVALTPDGARWVIDHGIQLIGIDYFSFELWDGTGETHLMILEAGLVAIEALDLSKIESGFYQLICLPLKIAGGDGAPARVILIEQDAA